MVFSGGVNGKRGLLRCFFYQDIQMNNSLQNALKLKPKAATKKDVVIRIGQGEPEGKTHPLEAEAKHTEANVDANVDVKADEAKAPKKQFIVDMRNKRDIDRNLILEKLKRNTANAVTNVLADNKEPPQKKAKIVIEDVEENEEREKEDKEEEEKEAEKPVTKAAEKALRSEAPRREALRKQKPTGEKLVFEGDADAVIIGTETIGDRMPKQSKAVLRASTYYMNNRRQFQQKLADLFKPHKTELMKPDDNVSCDFRKEGSKLELLTHQSIVRDYLNLYSPYRGLLIYHGLGSGKTCTSIAIAEGMKTERPIYVLTPASLSTNYTAELRKCGDPLYKKNQYWEFVDTRKAPQYAAPLAKVMSLTDEFVRSHGGVWMVNVNKRANFDTLSVDDQAQIEKQIDAMIKTKYRQINYNANNFMTKLVHYAGGEDANPFDNSVVIVDEAHNLVSRIVNKLKQPKSASYKVYEMLMGATNCKVVFLSGTPIINYPNEIAIMFNMLRGYIKTWTFTVNVRTETKINKDEILRWFHKEGLKTYDFVDYGGNKLTITRNPFGFVNVAKKGKSGEDVFDNYTGITLGEDGNISDDEFEKQVSRILAKHGLEVLPANIHVDNYTALPADKDAFVAMFIDPDTGVLKNVDLLQRRILGLTSYFKSAQEKLLPKYDKNQDFEVVSAEMSDYQFGIYAEARKGERDKDKKNRVRQRMDMYAEMSSTYRVFSRAFCNFAFPDPPGRPMMKGKTAALEGKNPNNDETDESLSEDSVDGVRVDEETLEETKDPGYDAQLKNALKYLKEHSAELLTPEHLQTYSNKLLKLLENVDSKDNAGLHLIYSQFRTIEGIGIIKLVLEANGYAEFKLEKRDGAWFIKAPEPEDAGKPRFALYTGTETKEEKEIVRNIYNSNWSAVPPHIKDELLAQSNNNYMGEIIKVFMITASGAEGINLENTRFVHIMEPYWHPVRTEQVVGRARRICSHSNLPEELRTVHVYLYLSVLSQEQKTSKKNIELRTNDVSRTNKNRPVTTDEYLYELSNMKDDISKQILKAVKETAMDCALHKSKKNDEKLVCYTFGKVMSNEFATVPNLEMDATQQTALNVRKETLKGTAITIYGIKYIRKQGTAELYNADTQEYVGKLVVEEGVAKILV